MRQAATATWQTNKCHHLSPLRYPGGKANYATFLAEIITINGLRGCRYFEPFAGGAGAALKLLQDNVVESISLNDKDKRIFLFWHHILNHTDAFLEKLFRTKVSIKEWQKQKAILSNPLGQKDIDIAFATFFLNRSNRSGIISGSGPIGGFNQKTATYKIDARFNKENLGQRIQEIASYKERINLSNRDGIDYLKSSLPRGHKRKSAFAYIDPPYVSMGGRLYFNDLNQSAHIKLSRYLLSQKALAWVLSYDDHELIRRLYKHALIAESKFMYSLNSHKLEGELIISPERIKVPPYSLTLVGRK